MGVYISSYHKRRVDYEEIYRNGTCGGDFGIVIYGTFGRGYIRPSRHKYGRY